MKINWDRAIIVPIYDTAAFPTRQECPHCEGATGWDTRPRSGGDRMEPDDYYWDSCSCGDGEGYYFSPTARVIRRFTIRLGHEG